MPRDDESLATTLSGGVSVAKNTRYLRAAG
jgi:hypothetical protein